MGTAPIPIPEDTEQSRCRACNGAVYWVPYVRKDGKQVNVAVNQNGTFHLGTCPKREELDRLRGQATPAITERLERVETILEHLILRVERMEVKKKKEEEQKQTALFPEADFKEKTLPYDFLDEGK